jgi:hypothetical protein
MTTEPQITIHESQTTNHAHRSTFVKNSLQIGLFMQNKPNFSNNPMTITFSLTNFYKQKPPVPKPPKQTQFKPNSNPIKPNFKGKNMKISDRKWRSSFEF